MLWDLVFRVFVTLVYALSYSVSHFEDEKKPITPKLLLISFDGFRWDYLDRVGPKKAPNFHMLIDGGVTVKYVVDAFVTKTFPNHNTIATGLWEESHGIVGNIMFDPEYNRTFSLANASAQSDPFWFDNGGVPIWVANQLKDRTRRSGVGFWPGGRAPINGSLPFKSMGPYVFNFSFQEHVDNMIDWFSDATEPINLGLLYFNQPDVLAHNVGPSSPRIDDEIAKLDKDVTGYLIRKLKEKDLFDNLNIIITSDHGFTDISPKRLVETHKYVNKNLYLLVGHSPIWQVYPKGDNTEAVYDGFKKVPHVRVYKKADIPKHYHYSNNRRIPPILVVADEGYTISEEGNPWAAEGGYDNGTHGYNNSLLSMHPFFIAHGPAFKKSFKRESLRIVDIYPLMTEILKITDKAGPNNGSLDNVKDFLSPGPPEPNMKTTFVTFILVIIGATFITGIFSIVVIRRQSLHAPRRFWLTGDGAVSESLQPMMSPSDDEL